MSDTDPREHAWTTFAAAALGALLSNTSLTRTARLMDERAAAAAEFADAMTKEWEQRSNQQVPFYAGEPTDY